MTEPAILLLYHKCWFCRQNNNYSIQLTLKGLLGIVFWRYYLDDFIPPLSLFILTSGLLILSLGVILIGVEGVANFNKCLCISYLYHNHIAKLFLAFSLMFLFSTSPIREMLVIPVQSVTKEWRSVFRSLSQIFTFCLY